MITHPGARTRALYMWEKKVIHPHEIQLDAGRLSTILQFLWTFEGRWCDRRPLLNISDTDKISTCQGRRLITLTRSDMEFTTISHEFVHARGFGSFKNPHNVAFVKFWISLMAMYGAQYYTHKSITDYTFLHSEMKRIKLL